jgi:hypothetical protein
MPRIYLVIAALVIDIPIVIFALLLFYPRPADKTPAWVFEGDSSNIDYCELPVLDGKGLLAKDIPQGHTPGCGWTKFPQPILRDCTEPLSEGSSDLRGLWQQVEGGRSGHVERVEQCGNRFVVTASGLIHDLTTDGEFSGASDDVRPIKLGPFNFCIRTSATTGWHKGKLEFYALGGPRVVSRYMQDGDLLWEYPTVGTTRMRRICRLPEDAYRRKHSEG